jgi:hypothetical protein
MEEVRRLRIQQRAKGGETTKEQELLQEQFVSALPFLPPLSEKTLGNYYSFYAAFCCGIIAFGALVAPILEFKMGVGGECTRPAAATVPRLIQSSTMHACKRACMHKAQCMCIVCSSSSTHRTGTVPVATCHRLACAAAPSRSTPAARTHRCCSLWPLAAPSPAGTSYLDFVEGLHLPRQLAQVDPIVASFCGGAVGVVSALLVIEINNIKQQQKNRWAAASGGAPGKQTPAPAAGCGCGGFPLRVAAPASAPCLAAQCAVQRLQTCTGNGMRKCRPFEPARARRCMQVHVLRGHRVPVVWPLRGLWPGPRHQGAVHLLCRHHQGHVRQLPVHRQAACNRARSAHRPVLKGTGGSGAVQSLQWLMRCMCS